MKNQLFEDLIESIKELPTEILEEMRMNMNEEQMRKDFEEWYDTYDIRTPRDPFDKEVAWEAFKASRESLVVELPLQYYANILEGAIVVDADPVYKALEKQGIKWK